MKRSVAGLVFALLLAASAACDRSPQEKQEAGRQSSLKQQPTAMTTVTLQISGFQKSKSGAT